MDTDSSSTGRRGRGRPDLDPLRPDLPVWCSLGPGHRLVAQPDVDLRLRRLCRRRWLRLHRRLWCPHHPLPVRQPCFPRLQRRRRLARRLERPRHPRRRHRRRQHLRCRQARQRHLGQGLRRQLGLDLGHPERLQLGRQRHPHPQPHRQRRHQPVPRRSRIVRLQQRRQLGLQRRRPDRRRRR